MNKLPLRAINETGDKVIDVKLLTVPDSAVDEASGAVDLTYDADNVNVQRVSEDYTATATAGATTTLTVSSDPILEFTGSSTQTVTLPVVSTLPKTGFKFDIINSSTGALTVNSSGGNLVQTIPAGGRATITAIALTGTGASSWSSRFTTAHSSAGALSSPTLVTPALGTPTSGNLGACVGGALVSYLVSTVTYNNVASLADTALSVTVEASTKYRIELLVFSTNVNVGLNLDFGGTATVTNFIGQWTAFDAAQDEAGPSQVAGARVSAAGTDFGPADMDTLSGPTYTFRGSIEVNAAGTLLLRGAQNLAVGSNTTILRGSTLVLTKIS